MHVLEKIETGPDVAPVRNENFKNAVEVFDGRLAIELNHSVENLEGLIGQMGLPIEFDNVGEERWGERVALGFEAKEKVVNEREVVGATEFEDKNEVRRVRVAEVGLFGSVVEDFLGQERV